MIKTTVLFDSGKLAERVEQLRAQGVADEVLAAVFASYDDMAMSEGNTQEELNELRAKVPESGRFQLVKWTVIHCRIDLV